ncbi:MAG: AAA family ATPase [Bacteroidia bacterium]|nr:AAA family ATPase [Bacteroidia bacterium]
MKKYFNDVGLCIPGKHFMVDTSAKIDRIMEMIERGEYFTLNRPRQYGKTTTSALLFQKLAQMEAYLVLEMSFEGIGDAIFEKEESFSGGFIELLADRLEFMEQPVLAQYLLENKAQTTRLKLLSKTITQLAKKTAKKIILLIDEVDKSSNNALFLHFVGMLRDKYLLKNRNQDSTFHSVILIGVHDIKTLKQKISPNSKGNLNSPWNIAVDFKVDLSFQAPEIETMLRNYTQDKNVAMDIPALAEKIYYYTSGYPYLVSKLCKFIDEDIFPEKNSLTWDLADVEAAFRKLTYGGYTTTLFDSLFKYLESYDELYQLCFHLIINGKSYDFNLNDPVVNLAATYGILRDDEGLCKVHNRVFEQRMYAYFLSRQATRHGHPPVTELSGLVEGPLLHMDAILQKFQEFMQENYSAKDADFLERQGRLLFLSFLKPILNGRGFDFKEPVVGDERRIDLVITYFSRRYVVEMKIWRGESYHQKGLQQLAAYLEHYQLREGFLLIFDIRKNKTYKQALIQVGGKEIFAVWV